MTVHIAYSKSTTITYTYEIVTRKWTEQNTYTNKDQQYDIVLYSVVVHTWKSMPKRRNGKEIRYLTPFLSRCQVMRINSSFSLRFDAGRFVRIAPSGEPEPRGSLRQSSSLQSAVWELPDVRPAHWQEDCVQSHFLEQIRRTSIHSMNHSSLALKFEMNHVWNYWLQTAACKSSPKLPDTGNCVC